MMIEIDHHLSADGNDDTFFLTCHTNRLNAATNQKRLNNTIKPVLQSYSRSCSKILDSDNLCSFFQYTYSIHQDTMKRYPAPIGERADLVVLELRLLYFPGIYTFCAGHKRCRPLSSIGAEGICARKIVQMQSKQSDLFSLMGVTGSLFFCFVFSHGIMTNAMIVRQTMNGPSPPPTKAFGCFPCLLSHNFVIFQSTQPYEGLFVAGKAVLFNGTMYWQTSILCVTITIFLSALHCSDSNNLLFPPISFCWYHLFFFYRPDATNCFICKMGF